MESHMDSLGQSPVEGQLNCPVHKQRNSHLDPQETKAVYGRELLHSLSNFLWHLQKLSAVLDFVLQICVDFPQTRRVIALESQHFCDQVKGCPPCCKALRTSLGFLSSILFIKIKLKIQAELGLAWLFFPAFIIQPLLLDFQFLCARFAETQHVFVEFVYLQSPPNYLNFAPSM